MKILVVSHTYIASINREKWKVFAQKYKDSQIKVLIPKNWPASLFDISAGNCAQDNLNNCEFISLDTRKAGNEVLYNYKFSDLFRILKKFKPDVIHVEQGDNALSYFQLILVAKLLRLKSKFTFFTWVNWKHRWSLKYRLFWSFIEKFNLKNSSGAIVGNTVAKDILREKKYLKEIEVLLQLGVNTKYFYPVQKEILKQPFDYAQDRIQDDPAVAKGYGGHGKRRKRIGFIGRIIKEKGVFDLVTVFKNLHKKYPEWKLVFVGAGKELNNLIDYVNKNNLQEHVEFLPPVDHKLVGEVLNKFDIFILPSYDTPEWKEQFGHVLIEAMACGVPVLGSDAGNIANVIRDSGLVFKQKNLNDFEGKLELLIKRQSLREELSKKGYDLFTKNYSYNFIAERTYNFWQKIL